MALQSSHTSHETTFGQVERFWCEKQCQAKTTDQLNVNLKPPVSIPYRIVVLDEYKHQIKARLIPCTVLGIARVHVLMFVQSETDTPRRWGEQYQAVGIVLEDQGVSDEDVRLSKSLIIQACQSDGSVYGSGLRHAISTASCTMAVRLRDANGLL